MGGREGGTEGRKEPGREEGHVAVCFRSRPKAARAGAGGVVVLHACMAMPSFLPKFFCRPLSSCESFPQRGGETAIEVIVISKRC